MKRTVLGSQEFPGFGGVLVEEVTDGRDVVEEDASALSAETVSTLCSVIYHGIQHSTLLPAQRLGAKAYLLATSHSRGRQ